MYEVKWGKGCYCLALKTLNVTFWKFDFFEISFRLGSSCAIYGEYK